MKWLSVLDNRLNQLVVILTELLLAGMFVITIINVCLRYFLDVNLLWAYDILRVLFVGFVFFAASIVTFRREHASFVFVKNKLPAKGRYLLDILENIFIALFYGITAYYGCHLCFNVASQKMPASGISAALLYLLMEAAVIIMSIHCLAAAVKDVQMLCTKAHSGKGGAQHGQ